MYSSTFYIIFTIWSNQPTKTATQIFLFFIQPSNLEVLGAKWLQYHHPGVFFWKDVGVVLREI